MLDKTEAIVLNSLKYGDTSLIVHLFTEKFGRQSYLIKGALGSKSKLKAALFQPLQMLELEVYLSPKSELKKLKEARIAFPLNSLQQHPVKNAVGLFMAELLYRSVREVESNTPLYHFITSSVIQLEGLTHGIANFHLWFMLELTSYLGVAPDFRSVGPPAYFDLTTGMLSTQIPHHDHYVDPTLSQWLISLSNLAGNELDQLALNHLIRNQLLDALLQYYSLHLEGMRSLLSAQVLKEVFA